jgi:hypothetical protein
MGHSAHKRRASLGKRPEHFDQFCLANFRCTQSMQTDVRRDVSNGLQAQQLRF